MASSFSVSLSGVPEMQRALNEAAAELRTKIVRKALKKAGNLVKDEVVSRVPVLKKPDPRRTPGTLKKSISVAFSMRARKQGQEAVSVGVRLLSKAKVEAFKRTRAASGRKASGSENPNDPYYWLWVEFNHRYVPRKSKARAGVVGGLSVFTARGRSKARKWMANSITGRRRAAVKVVPGQRFLRRGAHVALPRAAQLFIDSVIPEVNRLNRKAARVR